MCIYIQCRTQSIFGDTNYSCYCKVRLVTPLPHHGDWGDKNLWFILITLDRWKRHFPEKNYIENYFYLLKKTKSTKTTSQKCWRNIMWADFFGHPYRTNSIKTLMGFLMTSNNQIRFCLNNQLLCYHLTKIVQQTEI